MRSLPVATPRPRRGFRPATAPGSRARGELLAAIDARFDAMIAAGAVEEVRALDGRGLDARSPAMNAHGVPWLRRHLAGEMTLADAASEAKRDTKRYTKPQAQASPGRPKDFPLLASLLAGAW